MVQTGAIRPTDLHRVFLQSMLSRRVIPEEVLVELYKRALGACQAVDDSFRSTHQGDKQGARSFVKDINKILDQSGMQMEIKSVKDEENQGRDMWALINVDPAEEASMMTDYEPLQITYFRVVVNAIITSYPANSVGSNQALSLVSSLPAHMTKAIADGLLTSFVGRGWMFKSKRGRYSLAPRAILELDNWLAAEHEDMIQKCARCHKTVLTGIICGNIDCDAHIHKTCYSILMTAPRPKCTACSTEFAQVEVKPLGEKSVRRTEDHFNQIKGKRKRPSAAGKGKGRASAQNGEDEDDDEDEQELEEEEGDGGGGTDTGEVEEEEGNPDKSSGVLAGNGPLMIVLARWKVATNRTRTRKGTVIPDSEEEDEEDGDEEDEAPRTRRRR